MLSVANHYNERKQHTREERAESPVYALRCVNNWIKTVLIADHAPQACRVLDLCGGRGGDLAKWAHHGASQVTLIDVAKDEVERAQQRWNGSSHRVPSARFLCMDAFAPMDIPTVGAGYQCVSCQFALHYAFESEQRFRTLMNNVSRTLTPGGTFICTFPNPAYITEACFDPVSQQEREFDNGLCRIRFEFGGRQQYLYGNRYHFSLGDAIFDCPEYLVNLDALVSEARDVGLHLVRMQPFDQLCYTAVGLRQEHAATWQRMITGEIPQQQWDVVRLYMVAVFVRDDTKTPPLNYAIASNHRMNKAIDDVANRISFDYGDESPSSSSSSSQLTLSKSLSPARTLSSPRSPSSTCSPSRATSDRRKLVSYTNCAYEHAECGTNYLYSHPPETSLPEHALVGVRENLEQEKMEVATMAYEATGPMEQKTETVVEETPPDEEEEPEHDMVRFYARKPAKVLVHRNGTAVKKGERAKAGDAFTIDGHVYVKQAKGWALRE